MNQTCWASAVVLSDRAALGLLLGALHDATRCLWWKTFPKGRKETLCSAVME